MLKNMMLLGALLMVVGCAAAGWITENAQDAKLVTQYATVKVANGDLDKAARIAEIAEEVKAYIGDEPQLSVDLLITAIELEIRWENLDAADEMLVRNLLDRLRAELTQYLGPDVLPADVQLAATTVADWVIEATRFVR